MFSLMFNRFPHIKRSCYSVLHIRNCSTVTLKLIKAVKKKQFLDTLTIKVKGGVGGQGLPKYGGMGGSGGDVYLIGKEKASLKRMLMDNLVEGEKNELMFKAESGQNSKNNKQTARLLFHDINKSEMGKTKMHSIKVFNFPRLVYIRKFQLLGGPGKALEVPVPLGVSVSFSTGKKIGEILIEGDRLLVSKGGEGGKPANLFQHTKGHFAQINLDLKLIADVGLVGFPNAGKSSLIKSLSRINVKIKPYPFTTLHPQVGMMTYKDQRQISVADLPGLVEGAHINVGLGHSFLKHIERTKLLLFVVDLHGFQFKENSPHRTAFETVMILLKEMELTNRELLSKPSILAINKIDLPESESLLDELLHKISCISEHTHEVEEQFRPTTPIKFEEVIGISARNNQNVSQLKQHVREVLDIYSEQEKELEKRRQEERVNEYIEKQLTEHASGTWV